MDTIWRTAMYTISYCRFVWNAQVAAFREIVDHIDVINHDMTDMEKLSIAAEVWLNDHYGCVYVVINDEEPFYFDNCKKLKAHGLGPVWRIK